MPPYRDNPFQQPPVLVPGVPVYLFGSYNFSVAQSRILITNTGLATNVVTVTGNLVEGPPPVVGGTISLQASQNGAGAMNVNRATILSVVFNALTGVVTVTFALTNANITAGADTGTAIADNPEVPDTLVAGASQPVSMVEQQAQQYGNRTIVVECHFPTLPTAATVQLQSAIHNVNSEYSLVGLVATVAGSAQTTANMTSFVAQEANYYRLLVSGITGSGTIVAKMLA